MQVLCGGPEVKQGGIESKGIEGRERGALHEPEAWRELGQTSREWNEARVGEGTDRGISGKG